MTVERSERQHDRHGSAVPGIPRIAGPAPLRAPAPYVPSSTGPSSTASCRVVTAAPPAGSASDRLAAGSVLSAVGGSPASPPAGATGYVVTPSLTIVPPAAPSVAVSAPRTIPSGTVSAPWTIPSGTVSAPPASLVAPVIGLPATRHAVPTARRFREVVGRFATGVTVVTARNGQDLRGMTANSFTAVSLDPLLVLVCVRLGCATDEMLLRTPHFGINILSARQQSVAAWFADANRPAGRAQLDAVGWHPSALTATPMLDGVLGWLDCAVDQRVVIGDHAVVYGRVLDLGGGEGDDPLLFHRGRFGTVGSLPEMLAAG